MNKSNSLITNRPIITYLAWLHYITAFILHTRHTTPRCPCTLLQFERLVVASSSGSSDNNNKSIYSEIYKFEKPKRSAFGKAAIGSKSKFKNTTQSNSNSDETFVQSNDVKDTWTSLSSFNSTLVQVPILIHRRHSVMDETSSFTHNSSLKSLLSSTTSSNQLEIRRQEALDALKTLLSMSKRDSLAFLDTCPKLYTEIPNLSLKLTYLLEDINIKPKQLRRMIQLHPLLMETVFLDEEENIQSTVEILKSELDMSTQDIQMLESLSLPAIFNYPRSELRKRILVYKLDLKLSTLQLKSFVLKDPRVLRTDSQNVRRILLVLQEEFNITMDDVHTMLQKELLLLTYRAEENIRPTIHYLKQYEIGTCLGMLQRKGQSTILCMNELHQEKLIQNRLKSLVMGHPKILSSSLEKHLIPTVHFFLHYVGMTELEFGRLIYRRGGSILLLNIERSLKRKIDFFRQELDLQVYSSMENHKDGDASTNVPITVGIPNVHDMVLLTSQQKKRLLAQMLATNPDILTLSIESNLVPKFDYLIQQMGFTRAQLCHILLKRPQILALSLERNIIPKIECFIAPRLKMDEKTGLGLTPEEMRCWITENPQIMTCQLVSRIRSRIKDAVNLDLYLDKDLPSNFITRSKRSWDAIVQRLRYHVNQ